MTDKADVLEHEHHNMANEMGRSPVSVHQATLQMERESLVRGSFFVENNIHLHKLPFPPTSICITLWQVPLHFSSLYTVSRDSDTHRYDS